MKSVLVRPYLKPYLSLSVAMARLTTLSYAHFLRVHWRRAYTPRCGAGAT
ncbi:MAG: hypothetical protein WCB10_16610 [Steroidobacteraceae bacterium]